MSEKSAVDKRINELNDLGELPENIAQLRRELKYWRFMAIGAVVVMLLVGLLAVTGCEAPDSMYIRSTNTTPVHIFVDNTDDFPAGGWWR